MKTVHKILLLVLIAVSQLGMAQPMFQFSQYMFNDFALNPAIGGTHDYWQIRSNYRQQYAGLEGGGGPQTYMLGAYGPHKTMPMGYGGYIFNDVTGGGAVKYFGAYGSYAYSIRISGDIRLSMGLSLGVIQNTVGFDVLDEQDPTRYNSASTPSKTMPDGSLGFYVYTSQYFFGFAFNHLFFNNTSLLKDYVDTETNETVKLDEARIKPYFNIQGGYKYNLNRNFDIYPSVLMKVAPGFDYITDINARAIYQKLVWGGAGFRYTFKNAESVVFFVGYNYNDLVNIGYSYDVTLSKFGANTMGSHEVMIGVKFDDIRKSRSKRKIR